jgi:hypothetical protein
MIMSTAITVSGRSAHGTGDEVGKRFGQRMPNPAPTPRRLRKLGFRRATTGR